MPGPGAARSTAAANGRYRRNPDSEKNRITPSARWGMTPVRGPSRGLVPSGLPKSQQWYTRTLPAATARAPSIPGRREPDDGGTASRSGLRSPSRSGAPRISSLAVRHRYDPARAARYSTGCLGPWQEALAARDSLPCGQPRCSDERIGTTLAERDSGRRRPLLVTGAHRSGTTWVGRMIDLSPEGGYINEPFNPHHQPGICGCRFPLWFQYVNRDNEHHFRPQ